MAVRVRAALLLALVLRALGEQDDPRPEVRVRRRAAPLRAARRSRPLARGALSGRRPRG